MIGTDLAGVIPRLVGPYLMIQPATTSTMITIIIVASNPSPGLFFPNLNVMLYDSGDDYLHSGILTNSRVM
jgi:hypothetical protein